MITHDLHMHTEYCGHADGTTVEALIRSADAASLKTIAITDHVYSPESLDTIVRIKREARQVDHSCRIIVGAEIDVDGSAWDGRLVTNNFDGIDYVVAGLHYVPGVGSYAWHPDQCQLPEAKLFERWRSTILGLVENPRLHTFAHPVRMIATSLDFQKWFDRLLPVFEQAARLSAPNNILWEINEVSLLRLGDQLHAPIIEVFRTARDAGVKFVCGTDSHYPETVGKYRLAYKVLNELGVNALGVRDLIDRL